MYTVVTGLREKKLKQAVLTAEKMHYLSYLLYLIESAVMTWMCVVSAVHIATKSPFLMKLHIFAQYS